MYSADKISDANSAPKEINHLYITKDITIGSEIAECPKKDYMQTFHSSQVRFAG